MSDSAAIVVLSFDGYSDLWSAFFCCKDKNWPDCPYTTYLVSNHDTIDGHAYESILTGPETNWCDRVEKALTTLPHETVILLLEDYLIGSKVNSESIRELVNFASQKGNRYLRLIDIPKKYPPLSRKPSGGKIHPIFHNEEYGINLQPSIWNRTYLLNILRTIEGNRSAWDFEVTLLKNCDAAKNEPIVGCYTIAENVLNIHNGVLKGKWFPNELKYFAKQGVDIQPGQRSVLSARELFVYRIRLVLREALPTSVRKRLKKVLRRYGFTFVSDE